MHFPPINMVLNLKRDCNLTNKYDSMSMFFWRYHSVKPILFIRSRCQSFSQRMIIGELCWRQWGNLLSDGKDQKNAIEQLKPEERPCTKEYLPPLGFENDTRWNWLASSYSHDHVLAWHLPVMMTMMIFMIANII